MLIFQGVKMDYWNHEKKLGSSSSPIEANLNEGQVLITAQVFIQSFLGMTFCLGPSR